MKAKTSRKGLKVAISLLVAFAMIGIPANSISENANPIGDDSGTPDTSADTPTVNGFEKIDSLYYGENGTPPWSPDDYGRNEDNRYKGTDATDPYSDWARRPDNDTDVTYLNVPDPTVPHDEAPTEAVTTVTNWGDVERDVRVALQIYKEAEPDPEPLWEDNMESCYVNWTAEDGDKDGNTWARTEVRSNSPTHSWHNVKDCQGGTYAGNSNDTLRSKKIEIPEMCGGDKPVMMWLDFEQWIQGEKTEYLFKYEDYGNVYYRFDEEPWQLLATYEDSFGKWTNSALEYNNRTAPWPNYRPNWTKVRGIGYGTYDYDSDNNPIGWRLPNPDDHETVQIKFQWVSDPSIEYEGWYIDDVALYGMCGPLQKLVDQQYKPLNHPLHLEAFDNTTEMSAENGYMAPFQKLVQFPLDFDPEEDTTYFFESYTISLDSYEDRDGPADFEGDEDQVDAMKGESNWGLIRYFDPYNGVNESVYFGDWHDGAAVDIGFDYQEIEKRDDCVDVPLSAHVKNNGTIAERIPYTIEVRKTLTDEKIWDDMESGEGDWYPLAFDDECDAKELYWHMSDQNAHSPTHSWFMGAELGAGLGDNVYPNNAYYQALMSPTIDISDELATGTTVNMSWWHKYSIHNSDSVYLGVYNPETGLLLGGFSIDINGCSPWEKVSISDVAVNVWTGEFVDNLNELYAAAQKWFADNREYDYAAPMKGKFRLIWIFESDEEINTGPCGWGGYFLDDVEVWSRQTGETVASASNTTCVLEPNETSDEIEYVWTACDFSDYTAVVTTQVENDWNTDFKNDEYLNYMYNDEAKSGNIYVYKELYDQDFDDEDFYKEWCPRNAEWSREDNTFGVPASWTIEDNGKQGWQENHYAWTGEGAGDDDWASQYEDYFDDCLVPSDGNGDILVFDGEECDLPENETPPSWREQTAVEIEFDLWNEIMDLPGVSHDYLTLEVSNDSGDNWWIVASTNNTPNPGGVITDPVHDGVWSNLSSYSVNQEEWLHYCDEDDLTPQEEFNILDGIELFNRSKGFDYIPAYEEYDPFLGTVTYEEVGLTDNMTFRWHLISDGDYEVKGAYIDDVRVICHTNETIPVDGQDNPWMWTQEVMFEDDFESGNLDKWLNIRQWTGSMWWRTNTCSYSGDWSLRNFDPYSYSNYNKHLIDDPLGFGYKILTYDSSYMNYRNEADDKVVLDVDLSGVYQSYLRYMINYSIDEGFDFWDYNLQKCSNWPGQVDHDEEEPSPTEVDFMTVEVSTDDGETWETLPPYGYAGDSGGWVDQAPGDDTPTAQAMGHDFGIDLTEYVGQEIKVRWHMLSNKTGGNAGVQTDDVLVTGKEDTQTPTTTAILGPSTPDGCNGWYVSDVTVTLNAQDREMGTTYYRIDGGSWQTYSEPFQVSDDGEHTVEYYSVDAVGNEEAPKSVEFKIDQIAPEASIDVPQAGRIYLFGRDLMPRILFKDKALIIGPLTATASASDATSGVNYVTFETEQGGPVSDAVSPYQYHLPFTFGTDTLTLSVTDYACNENANVASVAYLKIL